MALTQGEKATESERERDTVCPRSSYPFYIVTYYINWVTTSWTYSTFSIRIESELCAIQFRVNTLTSDSLSTCQMFYIKISIIWYI